jgi:hypothetical protein
MHRLPEDLDPLQPEMTSPEPASNTCYLAPSSLDAQYQPRDPHGWSLDGHKWVCMLDLRLLPFWIPAGLGLWQLWAGQGCLG